MTTIVEDLRNLVAAATNRPCGGSIARTSCTQVNACLIARIGWCHRQAMEASTTLEIEKWHAEQKGLIDALLERDCTHEYPETIGLRARYARGLQDGRVLIQLAKIKPSCHHTYTHLSQ